MRDGVMLAKVLCGWCADERRSRPGVLGEVWKLPEGRVNWYGYDPRWSRAARGEWPDRDWKVRAGVTLVFPGYRVDVPDQIPVYCRHHGAGFVGCRDVTAASGTVAVKHKATT